MGYTWQLQNVPQQFMQSLVRFLLVFLFLQWEWLGKQTSQLSTYSFHPCYKFHSILILDVLLQGMDYLLFFFPQVALMN